MKTQDLVNKYAHCANYYYGSREYNELDNLSYDDYDELIYALSELGYVISYNNIDECYCVH